MTKFESPDLYIFASAEKIFNFLSKFSNFERLLPDEITNWTSTDDECSFSLQGYLTLKMEIFNRVPNSKIEIRNKGANLFEFKINAFIEEVEKSSHVKIVFEADLNPMLSMMAVKPIEGFVKMMGEKLKLEMEKE